MERIGFYMGDIKKNKEELWNKIKDIEGFLSNSEAYFLYTEAFECRKKATIVEVGSYCGKSTVCLALGLKDSNNNEAKVYAIDPFGGSSEHGSISTYETFKKNIREKAVEEFIVPFKGSSADANKAWDITKNIDFLWIDGGHEYEYVHEDITLWLKLVLIEGHIALHDTRGRFMYDGFLGVRRAVKEDMFSRECLKEYSYASSITCAEKTHCVNRNDAWKRWKSYQCWWIGKPEYNDKCNGFFGLIRLLLLMTVMNYKRIPKTIRKPWSA